MNHVLEVESHPSASPRFRQLELLAWDRRRSSRVFRAGRCLNTTWLTADQDSADHEENDESDAEHGYEVAPVFGERQSCEGHISGIGRSGEALEPEKRAVPVVGRRAR